MRNADVLQEANLNCGLMNATTGLSTSALVERACTAQNIISAADAAADHVAQNNDITPDVSATNSSMLLNTTMNIAVGTALTFAMPAFAPAIAAIGAAQFGNDAKKAMQSTEFKSFADENDGESSYEASSAPSVAEMSKQQAPIMEMQIGGGSSFAESVDQSVKDRGADEIYAELKTGKTRLAAEGQLAFSIDQLENGEAVNDPDYKVAAPQVQQFAMA